jgi:hypothetical protein
MVVLNSQRRGGEELASQRSLNAIDNRVREGVRPVADCLRADADGLCSAGYGAAEKANGFCFEHAKLNHGLFQTATMLYHDLGKLAFMDEEGREQTFGWRLEVALGIAQMSRVELGDAIGMTPAGVGQVINGQSRAMNAANTAKAAKALGVNWFWLATGEGDPHAQTIPVSRAEALAVDDLRALNEETRSALLNKLHELAESFRATDSILLKHQKAPGYHAATKLPYPPESGLAKSTLLFGGTAQYVSGLGGMIPLSSAPKRPKNKKGKQR